MKKYIVLEKAYSNHHERDISAKSLRGAMQIATRSAIFDNGKLQIWAYIANQAVMLAEKENYGWKNRRWVIDHALVKFYD